MSLDASELAREMLRAAARHLKKQWPHIREYAESEFRKIAADIVFIQRLRLEKRISAKRARLHLEIQKNAARTVLLANEGLEIIAVENAINAALSAVRRRVNRALGFILL